jgi:hypothetical protein
MKGLDIHEQTISESQNLDIRTCNLVKTNGNFEVADL